MTNLYARLDRMDLLEPLFMDLTWGAGACTQTRRTALTVTAHAVRFGSESHWAMNCDLMWQTHLQLAPRT